MSHPVPGFGAIDDEGPRSGHKDTANVDAADGILVVQIRRLGTISREILQPAACAALITIRDQCMRQCGTRSASRKPSLRAPDSQASAFPFRWNRNGALDSRSSGFLDAKPALAD